MVLLPIWKETHTEKLAVKLGELMTGGGAISGGSIMLDYIANRAYTGNNRENKILYYAFIDFKKAYDSINREKLIEVLIRFNINPYIINMIIQRFTFLMKGEEDFQVHLWNYICATME